MKSRRLAGPQLGMTIAKIFPEALSLPLGIVVSAEAVKAHQTDQQRESFHLLLSWWLDMDPAIAKNLEDLKTKVLMSKFGAAKVTDEHGNEAFMPVRRTTQEFDWERGGYKRKLLSKKLYIELIDHVYQMASQDGVVLPELDPRKAS